MRENGSGDELSQGPEVGVDKDATILRLLARLRQRLGAEAFALVDHWDADRSAIGVSRRDEPGTLAYISTAGEPPDGYFLSLELPPTAAARRAGLPYSAAGEHQVRGFDELVEILLQHFATGQVA